MLKRLRAALVARSTVILLLALLTTAMAIAAVVPQGGLDTAAGAVNPTRGDAKTATSPGAVVAALGLDHVTSTPWFAALAVLFVSSLALSTLDQLRLARSRTFQLPREEAEGAIGSTLAEGEIRSILRGAGYRRLSGAEDRSRHVRHWQGYWGNFLLHAGMTVVVLFSVVYVITEHRAILHVVAGRPSPMEPGGYPVKRGLLARELPFPASVSLYKVEPRFGTNDQLIDVASQLIFTDGQGDSSDVRVAVNDLQRYRGITLYQLVKYGHAFWLRVADGTGTSRELLLEMAFPGERGGASYVNEPLEGGRLLKAKYYASADRSRLLSDDPQLVLRLQDGDLLLGEATLQEGQVASLGPLSVQLLGVDWWTEILFEGSLGTSGIFAGFGVLLVGAALIFFVVPREVIVRSGAEGTTVQWRSTRFPEMYREEGDRIVALCIGERVKR